MLFYIIANGENQSRIVLKTLIKNLYGLEQWIHLQHIACNTKTLKNPFVSTAFELRTLPATQSQLSKFETRVSKSRKVLNAPFYTSSLLQSPYSPRWWMLPKDNSNELQSNFQRLFFHFFNFYIRTIPHTNAVNLQYSLSAETETLSSENFEIM